MARTTQLVVILGLLVTILPLAAASTEGTIATSAPLRLQTATPIEADVGALLISGATEVPVFELVAPRARVTVYEFTSVGYGGGWTSHMPRSRSWELTDLTVTVDAPERARFTTRDAARPPSLSFVPDADVELVPMQETDVVDTLIDPFWTYYPEPYLGWAGDEEVVVTGDFYVSFSQVRAHLDAKENATTIDTRAEPAPRAAGVALPTVGPTRVLVVDVDGGTWRVRTNVPTETALAAVRATNVTASAFADATGTLGGATLDEDALLLQGDFSMEVLPRTRDEDPAALARISGDVIGYGEVSAPAPARPAPIAEVLAGLAACGLVAGAVAYQRRRRALDVHQCVQLAGEAAEAGDPETALAWTREALRHAPGSAQLRSDEGFFLEQLGDAEGALAAYRRAAQVGRDGQGDYLAARLLAGLSAQDELVVEHLARAVRREPALVLEVTEDPVLARYATASPMREAAREARSRL